MTPRQRYCEAHRRNWEIKFPQSYKDGHYFSPNMPDINSTNGLQRYIEDMMNWNGHHAERINTMGIPKAKTAGKYNLFSGKVEQVQVGIEWRRSGSTAGSADVHGHFNLPTHSFGVPFKAEVKFKKDTMSKAQEKYKRRVTETGALHVIVHVVEDWLTFYDWAIKL